MNARAIFKRSLLACTIFTFCASNAVITTLSRNDPAPPYTTDNPFAFLGTAHYEYLKDHSKIDVNKHFVFEILPFYQRADKGSNSCGCTTELGDISGRWNMIALLPFNFATTRASTTSPTIYTNTNTDLPCRQEFPQILVDIRNQFLTDVQNIVSPTDPGKLPTQIKTVQGFLDLQRSNTALNENLGYFAVGMKYKKAGVRFNTEFYIGQGVGFTMQTGFASIDQCASFTDRTPYINTACKSPNVCISDPFPSVAPDGSPILGVTAGQWNTILRAVTTDIMSNLDAIVSSTQMNYSLCSFHQTSMEDLYGELFWRYPAQINKSEDVDSSYPKFLFVPYFALGGTYAIAKCRDFNQLLSLPFGNNGHSAARIRGGFSLDFYDTVDVNFEVGVTAFKSQTYCNMPMPNNNRQWPIFPFRVNARVSPGNNWHVALGMTAHNFWYNWSSSFHYIYVNHAQDCISIASTCGSCNNAAGTVDNQLACRSNIHPFNPETLMCASKWSSQLFDWSLNYAIAPDFSIGGLIQIPIRRKNAYRSSTFMLSLFINI